MTDPIYLRQPKPCSICKRPSVQKFHPFCSNRCAQIDLSNWFGGTYKITADDETSPDDELNAPT